MHHILFIHSSTSEHRVASPFSLLCIMPLWRYRSSICLSPCFPYFGVGNYKWDCWIKICLFLGRKTTWLFQAVGPYMGPHGWGLKYYRCPHGETKGRGIWLSLLWGHIASFPPAKPKNREHFIFWFLTGLRSFILSSGYRPDCSYQLLPNEER